MVDFYKSVLMIFYNIVSHTLMEAVLFWALAVFFFIFVCNWLSGFGGKKT